MKKLKVDLDEIAIIMETSDDMGRNVFDTETGEVVTVSSEIFSAIEDGDEESLRDLPNWQKDEIETAKSILSDEGKRYVEIPRKPFYEAYNLMVEFTETIKNGSLREKLEIALDGKGAFRRFKNVLSDYPEEEKRWFAFKDERVRQGVIEWLNDLGIEPIE